MQTDLSILETWIIQQYRGLFSHYSENLEIFLLMLQQMMEQERYIIKQNMFSIMPFLL